MLFSYFKKLLFHGALYFGTPCTKVLKAIKSVSNLRSIVTRKWLTFIYINLTMLSCEPWQANASVVVYKVNTGGAMTTGVKQDALVNVRLTVLTFDTDKWKRNMSTSQSTLITLPSDSDVARLFAKRSA